MRVTLNSLVNEISLLRVSKSLTKGSKLLLTNKQKYILLPKFDLIWQLTVYSQINNKMAAIIAISEDIARPGPAVMATWQPSDGFSAPSAQLENKNKINSQHFTAKKHLASDTPCLGMCQTLYQVGI